MRIAVVNAGSATVKAALAEVSAAGVARVRARGFAEVGAGADYAAGTREALVAVGATPGSVDGVGHRVVHGGAGRVDPVTIDEEVVREIEARSALAPLHNPPALAALRAARVQLPDVPHFAAFDTAFHARRTPESMQYALPPDVSAPLGLLRYGFHGIAHASLVESLAEAEGVSPEAVDAVTLQLGAGCSACAVARGVSIETSMGFTPQSGLVMATRAGDVDPGAVLALVRSGRSAAEVDALLAQRSGLLGLAGSADMRVVLAAEGRGEPGARLALALFVRRIVATAGAYFTLLGGRGALVFGGGIGANAPEVRHRVCAGLGAWGVALDEDANSRNTPGRISRPGTRSVYALATDEERWIARAVARLLAEAR